MYLQLPTLSNQTHILNMGDQDPQAAANGAANSVSEDDRKIFAGGLPQVRRMFECRIIIIHFL